MNTIDILCIGETLIDFIGHETNATIHTTDNYQKVLGGSPTNVAFNAKRLGLTAAIVSTVGNDGLGDYALEELHKGGVITEYSRQSSGNNTSMVLVSKSTATPDFLAYRDADMQILPEQLPDALLLRSKIYHTTSFALSNKPAQFTILGGAKRAKELGLTLSIDFNYSEKIWPDRQQAAQILKDYCSYNPLVKISNDDCERFFGDKKGEAYIFNYFHEIGAQTVCLTKGKDGVALSRAGQEVVQQEASKISIIHDTTGAGDAFWTGFLYGQLNGLTDHEMLSFAQRIAALKLMNLPHWELGM